MIFKNIQIPIKWFLTIIFFIGGILQYLQILSVTQTNILLLFIIATTSGAKFKKNDFNDLVLFALLAHVFIVFLINKSTLVSFFAYIYFLMCIFLSRWFTIQVVNFYPKIFNTDLYLKIGLSLLIIQIPILVLQNIFGEFIGAHAPISEQAVVGEVFGTDMAYGTLFFKSDSTLTAIATLFFISTFALNASFKFRFNVFLTSLLIVFLCNSIAFRYLLISIGVFLFVFSSKEKFGIYKPLFIGLFIITTTIIFIYFKEISKIYFEILDEITYWYLFRSDGASANRLAPLGEIIQNEIIYFGNGLLYYYNPITKTYLYNSGPGTFYTLYLDTGLIGILIFTTYIALIIYNKTGFTIYYLLILLTFLIFSFFNFALTDLTFLFVFNITLIIIKNKQERHI